MTLELILDSLTSALILVFLFLKIFCFNVKNGRAFHLHQVKQKWIDKSGRLPSVMRQKQFK